MKHGLQISGKTAQVSKHTARMLRGYDPLRAIYQGNLVSALFFSELILIGFASMPTFDSAFFFVGSAFWGLRVGMIILFFLLLGSLPLLLMYKRYRAEGRIRASLRQEALTHYGQAPTQYQSSPTSPQWPLPMQVTSQRKRALSIRLIFEIGLLTASLITDSAVMSLSPSQPRFLYALPGLLAIAIMSLSIVIWLEMRLPIAGHYLLPSLTIDDEAIAARYGHLTITIPWQNIRYFALVDSNTFRQFPTSDNPPTFRQILKNGITYKSPPLPEHEVFEISDGENIICWLKATPFRHHRLFRFGEVALSDEDYATFTQQLASLLMEKTNLPLYDLRIAMQKSRGK
jgi:hypothetical protein